MLHFLPKVDLNNFDGYDLTGWVDQMEHYASVHAIKDDLLKFKIIVLYLD
jgi:hypothetical protein